MRTIFAALALLTLGLAHLDGGANELRCDELGTNCICSEPFDNSDGDIDSSSTQGGLGGPYNPSDTSSAQTNCTDSDWDKSGFAVNQGVIGHDGNDTGDVTMVSGADQLLGFDVVERKADAQQLHIEGHSNFGLSSTMGRVADPERCCIRAYIQYDDDWPSSGGEDVSGMNCPTYRNKLLTTENNTINGSFEVEEAPGSPTNCNSPSSRGNFVMFSNFGSANDPGPYNFENGSSVSVDLGDCEDSYCRIEICANADDLTSTDLTNLSFDGYINTLGGGADEYTASVDVGTYATSSGDGLGLKSFHFNFFNEDGGSANGKTMRVSHFMQACWDSAAGDERIGRAYEVEGCPCCEDITCDTAADEIDEDGIVGGPDAIRVNGDFGCSSGNCEGDCTGDGLTGGPDVVLVGIENGNDCSQCYTLCD